MDRTRTAYTIITASWAFLKPYTERVPETDAEWDDFSSRLNDHTDELLEKPEVGEAEKRLLYGINLAMMNYVQQRDVERSTAEQNCQ